MTDAEALQRLKVLILKMYKDINDLKWKTYYIQQLEV